jgi:CheY-like chemotaxis protein
MYNILIVDFSDYRGSLVRILENTRYRIELCTSAYDAMSKLRAFDFHLIISEVELPGDNAFDLYNYIKQNYPYIPVIMTTEKNMNSFFEQIFREGIGNILCKPIKRNELLKLIDKLITKKNIFGLNNYMEDLVEIKKIRITRSSQIQKAIPVIMKEIEDSGFTIRDRMAFSLVLNEMAINAVYHSHGHTELKIARKSLELDEGKHVDLFFGYSKTGYGIAIDDYNGNLTKMKILESINTVIEQEHLIEESAETGEDVSGLVSETGRGIDFVRKLAGEFYFIIKENSRTEILIVFDEDFHSDDLPEYTSLKIIEEFD